ncbi:uncharacterized protein [Palaemon carinicauda]|uniref:uncharacterized protein n=1 Tax=Palaemon carinicauda TaxID=392227 RepID=UPI0035B5D63D
MTGIDPTSESESERLRLSRRNVRLHQRRLLYWDDNGHSVFDRYKQSCSDIPPLDGEFPSACEGLPEFMEDSDIGESFSGFSSVVMVRDEPKCSHNSSNDIDPLSSPSKYLPDSDDDGNIVGVPIAERTENLFVNLELDTSAIPPLDGEFSSACQGLPEFMEDSENGESFSGFSSVMTIRDEPQCSHNSSNDIDPLNSPSKYLPDSDDDGNILGLPIAERTENLFVNLELDTSAISPLDGEFSSACKGIPAFIEDSDIGESFSGFCSVVMVRDEPQCLHNSSNDINPLSSPSNYLPDSDNVQNIVRVPIAETENLFVKVELDTSTIPPLYGEFSSPCKGLPAFMEDSDIGESFSGFSSVMTFRDEPQRLHNSNNDIELLSSPSRYLSDSDNDKNTVGVPIAERTGNLFVIVEIDTSTIPPIDGEFSSPCKGLPSFMEDSENGESFSGFSSVMTIRDEPQCLHNSSNDINPLSSPSKYLPDRDDDDGNKVGVPIAKTENLLVNLELDTSTIPPLDGEFSSACKGLPAFMEDSDNGESFSGFSSVMTIRDEPEFMEECDISEGFSAMTIGDEPQYISKTGNDINPLSSSSRHLSVSDKDENEIGVPIVERKLDTNDSLSHNASTSCNVDSIVVDENNIPTEDWGTDSFSDCSLGTFISLENDAYQGDVSE